jgi:carbon monoxide dehydrogenase subunit G
MELRNTFTVPVGTDEAWRVMLDVRALAPCMPGATVDDVQGDDVLGRVKVKLGPIGITYKGKVTFVERDEQKRRVVLDASAREMRGSGTASARITAGMEPVGGGTEITVVTDLNITGKPAQFGRGVMADVSERIIGEFAANLAREIQGGELLQQTDGAAAPGFSAPSEGPGAASGTAPVAMVNGVRPAARERPSADSLDLFAAVGGAQRFRVPGLVAAGVAVAVVFYWLGRRSR